MKECVDHIEVECTRSVTMSTFSTTTLANFVRDPPPYMTSGILTTAYLDINATLDIDPYAFITTAQVSTSLNVAALEFQPYIVQA
jgi:hypothetical protein